MGAFGRAIADVGKGLMERNARTRELEDLAKIKAAEDQAAWDREAPKRELDKALAEQRIASSKAAEEASRLSGETSKLNAAAGKAVGGEVHFGQEGVDENGRTVFIPSTRPLTRTPDSIAADARSLASIAARNASTQASRENTSAYRAEQERSRLEAERRRVDEAAVDSAIQINSRQYRPNEYAARDKSLDDIEKARKARVAAIDEQILRLGQPAGLLSTAEPADDFASSQEAANALSQDPNVRVTWKQPDGSTTDVGPGSADMSALFKDKTPVWIASYKAAMKLKGADHALAIELANEDDAADKAKRK